MRSQLCCTYTTRARGRARDDFSLFDETRIDQANIRPAGATCNATQSNCDLANALLLLSSQLTRNVDRLTTIGRRKKYQLRENLTRLRFHITHIPHRLGVFVCFHFFSLLKIYCCSLLLLLITSRHLSLSLAGSVWVYFFVCNKLLFESIFWEVSLTCLIYSKEQLLLTLDVWQFILFTSTWKFIMWSSSRVLRRTQTSDK